MKKTLVAALTVATVAASLVTATPSAKAGDGVGAGIAAGLIGGAIVGGAIASSRFTTDAPFISRPEKDRFFSSQLRVRLPWIDHLRAS